MVRLPTVLTLLIAASAALAGTRETAATNNEGNDLFVGRDGERNPSAALGKYRDAARQGNPEALCNLGKLYLCGISVTQNFRGAQEFFQRAAKKGNPEAMFCLGYMYAHGLGVDKNLETAGSWYERAADKGHVGALNNLAFMLWRGVGMKRNTVEAAELFGEAVEAGDSTAAANLGQMYVDGIGIEENEAKGMELLERSALRNNVLGLYRYGEYLRLKKRYEAAAIQLSKAAGMGHAPAQTSLGEMFHQGEGMAKNIDEAVRWFSMAAKLEDPSALAALGFIYQTGDGGIKKDLEQAKRYLNRAAKKGSVEAQEALKTF